MYPESPYSVLVSASSTHAGPSSPPACHKALSGCVLWPRHLTCLKWFQPDTLTTLASGLWCLTSLAVPLPLQTSVFCSCPRAPETPSHGTGSSGAEGKQKIIPRRQLVEVRCCLCSSTISLCFFSNSVVLPNQ